MLPIGLAWGIVDFNFALLFFAAAYGLGLVFTTCTLLLEECNFRRYHGITDRLVLLFWLLVEGIGYRHVTVVWRLRGIVNFLRGSKQWGTMQRTGFTAPRGEPAPVVVS